MFLQILTAVSKILRDTAHDESGSFRPGSFRPIFGVGRFGLDKWVVSANFIGESIRPWVVSAEVYRNASDK